MLLLNNISDFKLNNKRDVCITTQCITKSLYRFSLYRHEIASSFNNYVQHSLFQCFLITSILNGTPRYIFYCLLYTTVMGKVKHNCIELLAR